MLQIVADSSCDLPRDLVEQGGITIVPMAVEIDGEEFHEGVDITPREFYGRMARSTALPKTSQPSPAAFEDAFDAAAKSGPVLCITISSKLSGTFQSAVVAADLAEAPVTVFDSLSGSLGHGLQVLKARELASAGAGVDEVVAGLTAYRDRMETFVLLDTLENIVKGGRLSRLEGGIAQVLDIRVILHSVEGAVVPLEKVHGKRRFRERAMARIREISPDMSGTKAGITHLDNAAGAEEFARFLKDECHAGSVFVNEMGPTMATYAGQGGLIVSFQRGE